GAGAMSAPVADRAAARRADRAAAAALAGLPGMGPRRLAALMGEWGATGAWNLLVQGKIGAVAPRLAETVPNRSRESFEAQLRAWVVASRATEAEVVLAEHDAAGVAVLLVGDPGYPEGLVHDVEAPSVLFARGDLDALG